MSYSVAAIIAISWFVVLDASPAGAERFIPNGNGTVTDSATGLIWMQVPTHFGSWEQTLAGCAQLDFAGSTEWRLPNIKELLSMFDLTRAAPALDETAFARTPAVGAYFSSTTSVRSPHLAFGVDEYAGQIVAVSKVAVYSCRCVR